MNEEKRKGFLEEVFSQRRYILEIIVFSVIIALGINLASNSLPVLANWSTRNTLITGVVLCSLPVIYFIYRLAKRRTHTKEINALLIFNEKKNQTVPISGYRFSEYLEENLNCAFTENKDLQKIWETESLDRDKIHIETEKGFDMKIPKSAQIVNEAVEFYILNELSIQLTDYFDSKNLIKRHLKIFERKDIPDILLENRFIELFSKSRDERREFIVIEKEENVWGDAEREPDDKIVEAFYYTKDGKPIKFVDFDLKLPKRTIVKRKGKNIISIDMRRIKIDLKVNFECINDYVPPDFFKYYLGTKSDTLKDLVEYSVPISIKVQFRILSLILPLGWEYYNWVDKFLINLDEETSKEKFFEKIAWNAATSIFKYLENQKKVSKPKKK